MYSQQIFLISRSVKTTLPNQFHGTLQIGNLSVLGGTWSTQTPGLVVKLISGIVRLYLLKAVSDLRLVPDPRAILKLCPPSSLDCTVYKHAYIAKIPDF